LHDPLHMVVVDETQVALVQQAVAFDEHSVRAVDQDFSDGCIAQQHLKRPETGEFVDDFFCQALHFIAGDRQVHAGDVLGDFIHHKLRQRLARAFQQVFPRLLYGIDDVAVQDQFEAVVIGVVDGAA